MQNGNLDLTAEISRVNAYLEYLHNKSHTEGLASANVIKHSYDIDKLNRKVQDLEDFKNNIIIVTTVIISAIIIIGTIILSIHGES